MPRRGRNIVGIKRQPINFLIRDICQEVEIVPEEQREIKKVVVKRKTLQEKGFIFSHARFSF